MSEMKEPSQDSVRKAVRINTLAAEIHDQCESGCSTSDIIQMLCEFHQEAIREASAEKDAKYMVLKGNHDLMESKLKKAADMLQQAYLELHRLGNHMGHVEDCEGSGCALRRKFLKELGVE